MSDTTARSRREYLTEKGWRWTFAGGEPVPSKPRKLFKNEEFQFLRPQIRREA